MGQTYQNWVQNQVSRHFLKFFFIVFIEIGYNDSLQQCLTSSRVKTHKKSFGGPNLGQDWTRNQVFFAIFLTLVHQFPFKLHAVIAWNNVQLLVAVKCTKNLGSPNLDETYQNRSQNQIFRHFLKFGLLLFQKISQNDSFEQILTTSRGKTYEIIRGAQISAKWVKIQHKIRSLAIFSSLVF